MGCWDRSSVGRTWQRWPGKCAWHCGVVDVARSRRWPRHFRRARRPSPGRKHWLSSPSWWLNPLRSATSNPATLSNWSHFPADGTRPHLSPTAQFIQFDCTWSAALLWRMPCNTLMMTSLTLLWAGGYEWNRAEVSTEGPKPSSAGSMTFLLCCACCWNNISLKRLTKSVDMAVFIGRIDPFPCSIDSCRESAVNDSH